MASASQTVFSPTVTSTVAWAAGSWAHAGIAGGVLAGLALTAALVVRAARRRRAEAAVRRAATLEAGESPDEGLDVYTVYVTVMATALSVNGMWHVFSEVLPLPWFARLIACTVLESAGLAFMRQARREILAKRPATSEVVVIWAIALLSGGLSAGASRSVLEGVIRVVLPLLAVKLLHSWMLPLPTEVTVTQHEKGKRAWRYVRATRRLERARNPATRWVAQKRLNLESDRLTRRSLMTGDATEVLAVAERIAITEALAGLGITADDASSAGSGRTDEIGTALARMDEAAVEPVRTDEPVQDREARTEGLAQARTDQGIDPYAARTDAPVRALAPARTEAPYGNRTDQDADPYGLRTDGAALSFSDPYGVRPEPVRDGSARPYGTEPVSLGSLVQGVVGQMNGAGQTPRLPAAIVVQAADTEPGRAPEVQFSAATEGQAPLVETASVDLAAGPQDAPGPVDAQPEPVRTEAPYGLRTAGRDPYGPARTDQGADPYAVRTDEPVRDLASARTEAPYGDRTDQDADPSEGSDGARTEQDDDPDATRTDRVPVQRQPRLVPLDAPRTERVRVNVPDVRATREEFVTELAEAIAADPEWKPDYEALLKRSGFGRSWCEKAVSDARAQARRLVTAATK